jgi:hypothetical protein
MSSPFSLADCAESDEESVPSSDGVLSSYDVQSTGWMFHGSVTVHMGSNNADFSPQLLDNMFKDLVRTTPVPLEHMIIFADQHILERGRDFSTSIRGYAMGKKTSKTKWTAWLQHTSWAPVSNISVSDEFIADFMRAEDLASPWFILGKYGKRKDFRIRASAFCFDSALDVYVQDSHCVDDDEGSSILHLVRTKLRETVDFDAFQSKGADFILAQCDVQQLLHASPGTTVRVPIQGFIQSKQTYIQTWQLNNMKASWGIAPCGLCGLEKYVSAISEASTWVTLYQYGKLKKNNVGRMEDKQASVIQSRASKCQLLLLVVHKFFRDKC